MIFFRENYEEWYGTVHETAYEMIGSNYRESGLFISFYERFYGLCVLHFSPQSHIFMGSEVTYEDPQQCVVGERIEALQRGAPRAPENLSFWGGVCCSFPLFFIFPVI